MLYTLTVENAMRCKVVICQYTSSKSMALRVISVLAQAIVYASNSSAFHRLWCSCFAQEYKVEVTQPKSIKNISEAFKHLDIWYSTFHTTDISISLHLNLWFQFWSRNQNGNSSNYDFTSWITLVTDEKLLHQLKWLCMAGDNWYFQWA